MRVNLVDTGVEDREVIVKGFKELLILVTVGSFGQFFKSFGMINVVNVGLVSWTLREQ